MIGQTVDGESIPVPDQAPDSHTYQMDDAQPYPRHCTIIGPKTGWIYSLDIHIPEHCPNYYEPTIGSKSSAAVSTPPAPTCQL